MLPTRTIQSSPVASAESMVTKHFHTMLPFHVAAETFLNEQVFAAMHGMSSLSTMLVDSPGTSVQPFPTVQWISDEDIGED